MIIEVKKSTHQTETEDSDLKYTSGKSLRLCNCIIVTNIVKLQYVAMIDIRILPVKQAICLFMFVLAASLVYCWPETPPALHVHGKTGVESLRHRPV